MCIFSGDVEEVNNTKIFISVVYPAKLEIKKDKRYKVPVGKPLQLVIYSNAVQNNDNIAMILPFPLISGKNRVKILDMSKYSNFFDDIELMFPSINTNNTRSSNNYFDSDELLEVHYVGNYKASIVPSFSSFDKLQYNEFNLKPDVKELLKKYYYNRFGFMVCIINNNTKKSQFHPFAYVHEIRDDNRIFIPTRHYHKKYVKNYYSKYHTSVSDPLETSESDTDVNDYLYSTLMIDDRWMKLSSKKQDLQTYRDKEETDWDHEIYIVNISRVLKNPLFMKPGVRILSADIKKLVNFYTYIESPKLPKEIVLAKPMALHKIKIDKSYKNNHDLYI